MWNKALGSALLSAGLLIASPAIAQEGSTISGNVALTSDYVFRGISQTGESPAIQGGADYTIGSVYAGTWASNVDFGELGAGSGIEFDLYGGLRPQVGPVALDFGVIGYFYPGVTDIQAGPNGEGELDYVEGYAKASISPADQWTLGAAGYYSPEFTGETGAAFYVEANAAYAPTDAISISGAVGYQSIDDVSGVFPGEFSDEYTTWNLGATYALHGFALDIRYVGTDIDDSDNLISQAFTTEARADDRVLISIKRAL